MCKLKEEPNLLTSAGGGSEALLVCRRTLAGMVKTHKSMTITPSELIPPVSGRLISIEAPLEGIGGSAREGLPMLPSGSPAAKLLGKV